MFPRRSAIWRVIGSLSDGGQYSRKPAHCKRIRVQRGHDGAAKPLACFSPLVDLHRWLAGAGSGRAAGWLLAAVVGVLTVAVVAHATQAIATPNISTISYSLTSGASSGAITPI